FNASLCPPGRLLHLSASRPDLRFPLFPYTTLFRSLGAARPAHPPAGLCDQRPLLRLAEGVVDLGVRLLGELLVPFLVPQPGVDRDRKSTRLNSSHSQISYAVFCLKKKTTRTRQHST